MGRPEGRQGAGVGLFDSFFFPFTVFTWDQPDCAIMAAGIVFRSTRGSVSAPLTQEDRASISVSRWPLCLPPSLTQQTR